MSPGGGAASLGIVLSQGPLPDLRPRVPRSPAPFTLRQTPGPGDLTGAGRSCSAFVPGYRPGSTAIFAPGLPIPFKSACLNRTL